MQVTIDDVTREEIRKEIVHKFVLILTLQEEMEDLFKQLDEY